MSTENIFNAAIQRLKKLASIANIKDEVLLQLQHTKAVLEVSIPVNMDDGSTQFFTGYRARHNDAKGPTKGGIRFHPNVSREEVMALAFWMSLKCALAGLPYGGGKGGVIVDPKKLSLRELEQLSKNYIAQIADFIGPDKDIPAPDVYTNPTIMKWMLEEYTKITRNYTPAVITGKPVANGGSLGRNDATGRGAYYCIKELEKIYALEPKNMTVAIQGFGNAGIHVANLLFKDGYKIVAISDSKTALYQPSGLDIQSFAKLKEETGCLELIHSIKDQKLISNNELLELNVDFLIPAALENQITAKNADRIKAKYIVEVANGPVQPEADELLIAKKINVIPDILANAGGVIVSYFEWVQNRTGLYWDEQEVHEKLQQKISKSFYKVYNLVKTRQLDFRSSAYIVALEEIQEAILGNTNKIKEDDKQNKLDFLLDKEDITSSNKNLAKEKSFA